MERMVAFCGIVCTKCPAYLATQKDDDEERKRVAQMWTKQFNTEIKPETINCDGCLAENGRHIEYCQLCEIRECGLEKGVKNCAFCDEYPCDKLEGFFAHAPDAQATLEEIRNA